MIIYILDKAIKGLTKLRSLMSSKEESVTPVIKLDNEQAVEASSQPSSTSIFKSKVKGHTSNKVGRPKGKRNKLSNKQSEAGVVRSKRNPTATLKKIKEVERLRKHKKMNIANACKEVGIAASYYYKLKDKA